MVRLKLVYHGDFRLHDPAPYDHPESPARLDAALLGLQNTGLLEELERVEPGRAGYHSVFRGVHEEGYLRRIAELLEEAKRAGMAVWVDPDTYVSPGTERALQRVAGAVRLALEESGDLLVLPRPPGHHAGRSGAAMGAPTLGFCILNTAAAVALGLHAQGARVAVLDFDLHHGNGTQEILYDKPVLHVDIHQDYRTIYPGSGRPDQTGAGEGRGLKVNINVPPGSGDDVMLEALDFAKAKLEEWGPDVLVVSAGFDAYHGDNPMGSVSATTRFYHEVGRAVSGLGARVVVILEGGYSTGLERGLPAFVSGLLGRPNPLPEEETKSPEYAWSRFRDSINRLREVLRERGPSA